MEQQGRVVQRVVTTETMTDKGKVTTEATTEYEEEESRSDRFWRGLDRASTIICVGVAILVGVTIVTIPKKKKDNPYENV